MSLTGEELIEGFSRFIGDWWESTTTSAGTTTSLLDTLLGRKSDNAVIHMYFRPTSGTADNQIRRSIVPFTASTGEVVVQPAFSAAIASGVTYQMHRYDPMDKWAALDAARLAVMPWVFQEVRDDTLTGDGRSIEFDIPSTIEWGPEVALIESLLPVDAEWNLATGDDARVKIAGNWVAAGGLAETDYSQVGHDKIVPRFQSSAVKLVYTDSGSDGTYDLSYTAFRNTPSVASFAGRHVEIGLMVYCEVAGVLARIVTDSGTLASSTAHHGRGWELLTVEGDIGQANATTLKARLVFPTGGSAKVAYFEEAFIVLGRLPQRFGDNAAIEVEYDATTRRVMFRDVIAQGYQVRLIGKAPLTALGDTTPWAGSMEVDEKSAQILYAEAAEQLFGAEVLSQPSQRDVMARIAVVRDKRKDYQKTWKYRMRTARFISPFAR